MAASDKCFKLDLTYILLFITMPENMLSYFFERQYF